MKTELSHNKIALYKSENLLSLFMITLFFCLPCYIFLPIVPPLCLSPITSSPLLFLLFPLRFYLVRSLQAINSSATTCGFWLSLMRASILRT